MTASPLSYGPFISKAQAKAQGIKQYFTGEPCKKGHLSVRQTSSGNCRACARLSEQKYKTSENGQEVRSAYWNSEKHREMNRAFAASVKGQACSKRKHAKERERRTVDSEFRVRRSGHANAWRRRNLETVRQYVNQRRASNPSVRFTDSMRAMLSRIVKGGGLKEGNSAQLFGCDLEQLREHIQRQFTEGMTLANYGEWHVDHIRPVASFDDPADPACWHYSNLQPMWAAENLAKSDRWESAAV